MDHVKRERYQRLGLVGLCLPALLLLFSAYDADGERIREGAAPQAAPFTIQGDARKTLLPGAKAARLDLRVSNRADVPLRVTDLAVTVKRIAAPNATTRLPCTRNDYAVRQAPDGLDVTIAPHSTSALSQLDVPGRKWPRVGMLNRDMNQDGCQQSTLTLAYTASGRLRR